MPSVSPSSTRAPAVSTAAPSEPLLARQLCFALHDASRAMTAAYRRGLAEHGLTYPQYLVMLVLWEHGSVAMGRLCQQVHLDSATLSPVLKRMEADGLLERRRRVEDERTVQLTCTAAGLALREGVMAVQARVERATGLSHDDLAALRGDLVALADRLREAAHEGA